MKKRVVLILAILLIGINAYNLYQNRDSLRLMPVTGLQTANGTGYVGVSVVAAEGVNAPENFTITLDLDNQSITLNWSNVTDADSYVVYYSSNVSAIVNLSLSNIPGDVSNFSYVTDLNYTDTTANTTEGRFYRVASVNGDAMNLTNKSVGKFDIDIHQSSNQAGVNEGTLMSLPLSAYNKTLENLIRTPSTNDILILYNRTTHLWKTAKYWGAAFGWWNADFTVLNIDRGHWFTIAGTGYNLTDHGDVPESNLTVEIFQSSNQAGTNEGNVMGWNMPITRYNLSALVPNATTNDIILYYNTTQHLWKTAKYWGAAFGWWNTDFDCFIPSVGYWFTIVGTDYNWTQERIY